MQELAEIDKNNLYNCCKIIKNYTDAMTAEYHRLGDYIREVNVRNRELKVTNLLGLSMTKQFRPSTSNIVGVDLSNYKIVDYNTFAFDPMSVIRVHKVPIAINETANSIIVSPAYYTFEISDTSKLLPQYLMMWIMRPEFDRYADFKSDSAVRGGYDWTELCDTPIYVPSIERQREIVSEYETLTRRIRLNNQMIEKLEATAQALYHKTFVAGIDKQNLPDGWRIGTLGDIGEINSGKTCLDKVDSYDKIHKYPVAGASGIIGFSSTYNYDEKLMTTGRVGTLGVVNRYSQPMYMADNVLVLRSQYFEYCYQILRNFDYSEITKGGVQSLITQTDLKECPVIIPSKDALDKFEKQSKTIFKMVDLKQDENLKLSNLQTTFLSRIRL